MRRGSRRPAGVDAAEGGRAGHLTARSGDTLVLHQERKGRAAGDMGACRTRRHRDVPGVAPAAAAESPSGQARGVVDRNQKGCRTMPKFTSKTKNKEAAVFASSAAAGVHGESTSDGFDAGVAGFAESAAGIGPGVYGRAKGKGAGVFGENLADGVGGFFKSDKVEGLIAETMSSGRAAFACFQNNPSSDQPAIHAAHINGTKTAGFFKGNVIITGDLSFPGSDFAEDFTVDEGVVAEAGTVMAFGETGGVG